jgi:YD repeat-containing protein
LDYTFEYDGTWIGAADKITDASGEAEYQYDVYGRVKNLKRAYAGGTTVNTPEFTYAYDLLGNLVSETFPSGHRIDADYSYGFITKLTSFTSGIQDYSLTYAYNKWGLWSSISSSVGPKLSRTYTTPLWPDEYKLTAGSVSYLRSYLWHDNGLLSQRTVRTDSGSSSASPMILTALNSSATIRSGTSNSAGSAVPKTIGSLKGGTGSILNSSKNTSAGSGVGTKTPTKANSTVKNVTGKPFSATVVTTNAITPTNASVMTDGTVVSASEVYGYAYDDRMELVQINGPAGLMYETYSYDAAGNPTQIMDANKETWMYASASALNQIASRSSDKGSSETYTYDAAGRIATATDSKGTSTYYYDGLGRLRGVALNGVIAAVHDYDANGKLVRRADGNPFTGAPNYVYSFQEWRYDQKNGKTIEKENSFVTTENGARNWLFNDYDGHAMMTVNDSGTVQSMRTLGGYGSAISSTGTEWVWDSFHGAEKQDDLFAMGQRHLMKKDGQWLQPEPLLYLGIPDKNQSVPLSLSTHRYAMNSPTAHRDTTGFDPAVDVTPTYEDTYSARDASNDLAAGKDVVEIEDDIGKTVADATNNPRNVACVNNALAKDMALRGEGAYPGGDALRGSGMPTSVQVGDRVITIGAGMMEIENFTGEQFVRTSLTDLEANMMAADTGKGATAIVVGIRADGSSHAFNLSSVGDEVSAYSMGDPSLYVVTFLMITSGGDLSGN